MQATFIVTVKDEQCGTDINLDIYPFVTRNVGMSLFYVHFGGFNSPSHLPNGSEVKYVTPFTHRLGI